MRYVMGRFENILSQIDAHGVSQNSLNMLRLLKLPCLLTDYLFTLKNIFLFHIVESQLS